MSWTGKSVSRTVMSNTEQPAARNRGLDYARAFAIVFIFFIHSLEPLATAAADGSWGLRVEKNLLESLIRTGVCLFLGISGALLLGKQEPLKVFFRKTHFESTHRYQGTDGTTISESQFCNLALLPEVTIYAVFFHGHAEHLRS